MNWKRIGRTLVCLLVVLCLIIYISPIRAEAVAVGATAVTGTVAAGALGWLFAAAMGVVFVDVTAELISGIGESVTSHVADYYADDEQTTNTVTEFFADLSYSFGGSGDDGTNNGDDSGGTDSPLMPLPMDILAGLVDWAQGLITGDAAVEVEEETEAPDGYYFYSGHLFPDVSSYISNKYLYAYIYFDASVDAYKLLVTSKPAEFSVIYYALRTSNYVSWKTYVYDNDNGWYLSYSENNYEGCLTFVGDEGDILIWSNVDVLSQSSGDIWFSYSEPTYACTQPTVVEPSTYVGDIPSQVEDGTFDEDAYELPYINYAQIFQGQTDIVDALNNVASQLQDQTMTYEQYMELIQADASIDTDTDTDAPSASETYTGTFADTTVGTFIDGLVDAITAPFEWLANTLLAGIQALFVPSEDFLSEKVDALRSEFGFADSIIGTFEMFGGSFFSVDTSPPIIYIDLSQSEGSYYLGEEVVFLDLTWYEKYKPTVDILLSAFMWLCFFWRVGRKLPDIIRGASGDVPDTLETGLTVQR